MSSSNSWAAASSWARLRSAKRARRASASGSIIGENLPRCGLCPKDLRHLGVDDARHVSEAIVDREHGPVRAVVSRQQGVDAVLAAPADDGELREPCQPTAAV